MTLEIPFFNIGDKRRPWKWLYRNMLRCLLFAVWRRFFNGRSTFTIVSEHPGKRNNNRGGTAQGAFFALFDISSNFPRFPGRFMRPALRLWTRSLPQSCVARSLPRRALHWQGATGPPAVKTPLRLLLSWSWMRILQSRRARGLLWQAPQGSEVLGLAPAKTLRFTQSQATTHRTTALYRWGAERQKEDSSRRHHPGVHQPCMQNLSAGRTPSFSSLWIIPSAFED